MNDLNAVVEVLRNEDNFLITSHIRPDGDAVASQLALHYILRNLGKKVSIINQDPVPKNYTFLPNSNLISTNLKVKPDFNVSIILDCNDFGRIGEVYNLIKYSKLIINIDHHLGNGIGQLNLINSKASCVGEIIYQIAKSIPLKIDNTLATFIYTTIITDTGSFRFSNTSAFTHQIASDLLSCQVIPSKIHNLIYENNTPGLIKLFTQCLSTLNLSCNKKVVTVFLTKEMTEKTRVKHIETEMVTNLLLSIASVEIAIFLREIGDNMVRVNFRSKNKFDVNKLARFFNGGGHRQSSGCIIEDSLKSVQNTLGKKVREYIYQES
ncbi:MAG: bifunctional oligoribonuclease/PAP phosphatase NrnA [bacterium]|nr:bifunctional oligoribonuclease/PAP phosphatase NrnA [bacterium]